MRPPELDQLREQRRLGLSLHQMPRAVTDHLAEHHQVYTTTSQRDETLAEYAERTSHEAALGRIATRTLLALGHVPEFETTIAEGTAGSALRDVFGRVIGLEAQNVRVQDPAISRGRHRDRRHHDHGSISTVVIEKTLLTVPNVEAARALGNVLQTLLVTQSPLEFMHLVNVYKNPEEDSAIVEVGMLTDHDIRALGRAVESVGAEEDKIVHDGFAFPPVKRRLWAWKRGGETFPPRIDERQTALSRRWQALRNKITATYRGYPDMVAKHYEDILGTDPAAVFQALRSVTNALLEHLHGEGCLKPEQNPNKAARLATDGDEELKRDPVPPDVLAEGPPNSRTLSVREKAAARGVQTVRHAKQKPLATLVELVGMSFMGAPEAALTALKLTPVVIRGMLGSGRVFKGWRAQKGKAREVNHKLDEICGLR